MKDSIERIRNTGKSLILRALADRIGVDGSPGASSMPSVNITPVSVLPKPRETTIHNGSEFQRLTIYVEVIIVVSHCCNESNVVGLDFSRFRNLREVRVGDDCFANVKDVSMTGLKKLEKVEFGKNCCCQASGGSFEVKECERLKSVKIGDGCFVKVRVVVFIGGCIVVLLRIDLPVLKTVDLGNDSFTGEVKLVMKSGN